MADDLRERFAAYAHEAWSGWMRHMFRLNANPAMTCLIVPKDISARWYRLKLRRALQRRDKRIQELEGCQFYKKGECRA